MIPVQRPPLVDEVVVKKERVIYGTVTVPAEVAEGDEYFIGKALRTIDGGITFEAMTENTWTAGEFSDGDVVYHDGHIFTSLVDANAAVPGTDPDSWQDEGAWDANGVLIENIDATGMASVLITGVVAENKLRGYDSAMRHALFKNKITMQ